MDPLAHTLFGAALADTGLGRRSRHATATLIIGANLPDLDVLAHFWGSDAALYARRGWTHGVFSMLLMPLLLTGAMLLWARWRGSDGPSAPKLRPRWVLALSCIGVWSHPLLDWLNTYGVRLLMPFDGRWWYGDTLFIVDPWVWLMLAAGVVAARSASIAARLAWVLLAAIATWLVWSRGLPTGVLLAWSAGLALVATLRWQVAPRRVSWVARAGIVAMVAYVGVMFVLARSAEAGAASRYPAAQAVQASPVAGVPVAHRIVVAEPDRYRIIHPDGAIAELPRTPAGPVVQRALRDPSIRGFANWTRFPWWQVEPLGEGWRVRFHDLRYSAPGSRGGIGYAEVVVAPVPGRDSDAAGVR